jgi:hypothetical protein
MRSTSSRARSTSSRTSAAGWRQRPSTYAATRSGSVESGRPTPTRTRWKSGEPSSRRRDFRPLWPASPPPRRVRTSPNGRSISSWTTTRRSRSSLYERRSGGATGLVHERLRLEDRDARAAHSGAALGQLAGELAPGLGQLPALDQGVRDAEADVVRRVGVAGPGIAEPDDQPVDGCGAAELQLSSAASAFCSASSPVSPSA